jgi:hypothetical protein
MGPEHLTDESQFTAAKEQMIHHTRDQTEEEKLTEFNFEKKGDIIQMMMKRDSNKSKSISVVGQQYINNYTDNKPKQEYRIQSIDQGSTKK